MKYLRNKVNPARPWVQLLASEGSRTPWVQTDHCVDIMV